MPPASDTPDRLLAKVGALYYLQNQTQQQIADRLHVSRPKVSRMLKEARERGVVQITVAHVNGLAADLEGRLEAEFGLREVVVAEVDAADRLAGLGAAAADYLDRVLVPDAVIGLTWGTTLREMVKAVAPRRTEGVTVIQTLGGVGPPLAEAHAADLPRRLAGALGAGLRLLQAPGIVASEEARHVLTADPQIRAGLAALASMTAAFVGIGALSTNPILREGALAAEVDLPATLDAELREGGAVGDVALRFFDAEGRPVPTSLDGRVVGVDLATLAATDCVIGVAGGPEKVEVIRAALRGRLIDVLITDSATAHALLAAD